MEMIIPSSIDIGIRPNWYTYKYTELIITLFHISYSLCYHFSKIIYFLHLSEN